MSAAVWLIWSHEHTSWWRPNAMGYCIDVREAGRYTKEEADSNCVAPHEIAIHADDAYRHDPLLSEEHHANQLAAAIEHGLAEIDNPLREYGGIDGLRAALTAHKLRRAIVETGACPKSPKGA